MPRTKAASPTRTTLSSISKGRSSADLLEAQKRVLEVPLGRIRVTRRGNVRSGSPPELSGLAASIRKEGVLEPLIASPAPDDPDLLDLIAGFRRFYAAERAGLATVPVRVVAADDKRALRLALIENIQRADMNPLDKARGIYQMLEQGDLDQKSAAEALGVSGGFVSQHLALLRLPVAVQQALARGLLDMSRARSLGRLPDDVMLKLLPRAIKMTPAEVADRVEFMLVRLRADESLDQLRLRPSGPAPASLADVYSETPLRPLSRIPLRQALVRYANKMQRASSAKKKAHYKGVLRGLEIAAGLEEEVKK